MWCGDGCGVIHACAMSGADACKVSPASAGGDVITVSATTITDSVPRYSNTGSCVDIYAPGENITSAWNAGPTAYSLLSGTSVACPHVTGVAALILSDEPHLTPQQLKSKLIACASVGRINGLPATAATATAGSVVFPPLFADANSGTANANRNRLLCECPYTAQSSIAVGTAPPSAPSTPPPSTNAAVSSTGSAETGLPSYATNMQAFLSNLRRLNLMGDGMTATGGAAPSLLPVPPPPTVTGGSYCAFGLCVNFKT